MFKHIVNTNWFQNTVTRPSVAEKIIAGILKKHKIRFAREISFVGLKYKSGYYAKFDFFLIDFNICIEYDGELYHSSDTAISHDRIKNDYCKENNIALIRYSKSHYYRLEQEICNLLLVVSPVTVPYKKVKALVVCKNDLKQKKEKSKKRKEEAFKATPKKPSLSKKRRDQQQKIERLKAKGIGLVLPKGMTEEEYRQKIAARKGRSPG